MSSEPTRAPIPTPDPSNVMYSFVRALVRRFREDEIFARGRPCEHIETLAQRQLDRGSREADFFTSLNHRIQLASRRLPVERLNSVF